MFFNVVLLYNAKKISWIFSHTLSHVQYLTDTEPAHLRRVHWVSARGRLRRGCRGKETTEEDTVHLHE